MKNGPENGRQPHSGCCSFEKRARNDGEILSSALSMFPFRGVTGRLAPIPLAFLAVLRELWLGATQVISRVQALVLVKSFEIVKKAIKQRNSCPYAFGRLSL